MKELRYRKETDFAVTLGQSNAVKDVDIGAPFPAAVFLQKRRDTDRIIQSDEEKSFLVILSSLIFVSGRIVNWHCFRNVKSILLCN